MQESNDPILSCRDSLEKNIWPIFLTSISTAIGFFSLIPSDIKPISELGVLAGFGTLFALAFSYLIVIPQVLIYKMKVKKPAKMKVFGRSNLSRSYLEMIFGLRKLISII